MKAAVYRKYGPPEVLRVEEIPRPTIEAGQDDRVLIRVRAAGLNRFDCFFRAGHLAGRPTNGWIKPKKQVLGIDVAGTVEAVGKDVSRFKVGDAVFGGCLGSHAEYVRAREGTLGPMPRDLSFAEAAAIPTGALTALQALRDVAEVRRGQSVLVYGASGGVGHFAVQIAKALGAEVTAVCSASNLQWVGDLGADHVIDYAKENFARSGKRYDVILDAVGKTTFWGCRPALAKTGVYVTEHVLRPKYHILQVLVSRTAGDRRAEFHLARSNAKDFDFLRELAEAGKLRPVIDKIYPLDEIVDAHRHMERGHTKGKIVIET